MISLATARELFAYDPATGIIRWRKRGSGHWDTSVPAGNADNRYVWIKHQGKLRAGHKIAWLLTYGEWPDHQIDHIDGNTTNNRISNLRRTTIAENCQNRRLRRDNVAGAKGVQERPNGKWRARIWLDGRSINLGHFDTKDAAHAAYREAATKHFGEFARFA